VIESERLLEPDARVARSPAGLFNPPISRAPPTCNSQEELGYLPASGASVNQALHVPGDAGLLKVEYGRIRILDLDGCATPDQASGSP
jgi:hypothetical protein